MNSDSGYHNGVIRLLAKENANIDIVIVNMLNEETNNFISIENEIKHKECTVCGDELIKGTINKLPSSNNCNMSKVYIMNLISMFNIFALAILIFRKRR